MNPYKAAQGSFRTPRELWEYIKRLKTNYGDRNEVKQDKLALQID